MYIYDDTGFDKKFTRVVRVLAEKGKYQFVLLEGGEIGMINIETKAYISDERRFYLVSE